MIWQENMLNVIREGIQKGVFAYESNELEKSEQIACLENDAKQGAAALCYDLQTKLEFGFLQLVEDDSYF